MSSFHGLNWLSDFCFLCFFLLKKVVFLSKGCYKFIPTVFGPNANWLVQSAFKRFKRTHHVIKKWFPKCSQTFFLKVVKILRTHVFFLGVCVHNTIPNWKPQNREQKIVLWCFLENGSLTHF